MKPAQPPAAAVLAQTLRDVLREFLLGDTEEHNLKKFILDQLDLERCPPLRLAA